jgi:hypothetical protein
MEGSRRKPNAVCLICSKSIYRRPAQLRLKKERVFCSLQCYGIAGLKERPCSMCGAMIRAGLNKKTCSRACANIHRTGIRYYLGRQKLDKVLNHRSIKLRLLELRGGICERCGYSKREILHVHHKDRNRTNNNFSNLELICPNCHYEEHYLEKSWLNGSLKVDSHREESDSGSFQRT